MVDGFTFLSLLADLLRLPEETWITAQIYHHRYRRFFSDNPKADTLDGHSLSLSCISLATKATESPRRPREILLPAWRVLHPSVQPLTIPSETYDALRATVVQGELVLVRVLRFELRVSHALEFLPRYLQRAVRKVGGQEEEEENYDAMTRERREECRVVDLMQTGMGLACRNHVVQLYKHQCIVLVPARAIAVACVFHEALCRGLPVPAPFPNTPSWVNDVTGGRVDFRDVQDVVGMLRELRAGGTVSTLGYGFRRRSNTPESGEEVGE